MLTEVSSDALVTLTILHPVANHIKLLSTIVNEDP